MHILFDIGGTKMRLAVTRDGKTFEEPIKITTPHDDFDEGVRVFVETARALAEEELIETVVGGIAGPLDEHKSMLVNSPNISGWVGKPFVEHLTKALGAPVHLENDSDLVGLGEAVYGAGKGESIVAYLTVSTGVGGSRIVDGSIDRNRFGFEPGHHIVQMHEGALCGSCRSSGHLQAYISGRAFLERYGKPPYEVREAEIWEDAARMLAVGLNNIAVFWSPDVMVIGGAMVVGTEGAVMPFEEVERCYTDMLSIFPKKPRLAIAELGDHGGLYGALALLSARRPARKPRKVKK